MRNKLGEWYPCSPYICLALGTKLKHYVFNEITWKSLTDKQIKHILDRQGFQHPVYYRANRIANTIFHEFMTTNPKDEQNI